MKFTPDRPTLLQRLASLSLRLSLMAWLLVLMLMALAPGRARADAGNANANAPTAWSSATTQQLQTLVQEGARAQAGTPLPAAGQAAGSGPRVVVQVGEPDPRLKLAPCRQVEPFLPERARAWGRTRVGLRCLDGVARWSIYLPVTVQVWAPALVAARPLPAGTALQPEDFNNAEVDLAAHAQAPLGRDALLGRTLAQPLRAGEPVRQHQLKPHQWFAAGDQVKVLARGPGFLVATEGQALTAGLEGQACRVRLDNGRVLLGLPVGARRLEVTM